MQGRRKVRVGRVVSDKMDKTVVVAVETRRPHRLYRRVIRRINKFKAHDECNECTVGDVVRMEETRPLSREKRWRVVEVVSRREVAEVQPREIDIPLAELSHQPLNEEDEGDPGGGASGSTDGDGDRPGAGSERRKPVRVRRWDSDLDIVRVLIVQLRARSVRTNSRLDAHLGDGVSDLSDV